MGYFLIALSLYITSVFFIVISLFGLTYYGKSTGGSIFIVTVLAINIAAVIYMALYELWHLKTAKGKLWPYFIPLFLALIYALEMSFNSISLSSQAGSTFRDVIAVTSLGIWGGTFCYRHRKYKEIVENIELIMFVSGIILVISLPTMFLSGNGASIGGAGDHQIVSYISAVAFGFSLCRFYFKFDFGYKFFKSKYFKKFSIIFMLVQAVVCVLGGGRGGLALLMTIFILVVLYSIKNVKYVVSFIIILPIFFLLLNSVSGSISDSNIVRAYSVFSRANGESLDDERSYIYSTAMSLIEERPLLGYGIYSQYNICQQRVSQPYWHNLFVEWLMQGGLVLFILGVSVLIKYAIKQHKMIKGYGEYAALIPVSAYPLVMLMFSGTYLLMPSFWFVIIYVLGVRVPLKNHRNR